MKKLCIVLVVLMFVSMAALAQGFYFDAGLGFGTITTEFDGNDFTDGLPSDWEQTSVELGAKLGYKPVAQLPLYVVADLSGLGHRIDDGTDWIQFNSYLVGGGVVFYPISLLQIAASAGYSLVAIDDSMGGIPWPESQGGFAYSVSAALDLGKGPHGLLVGGKYMVTNNTLDNVAEEEMVQTFVGLFVRYAYRVKQFFYY